MTTLNLIVAVASSGMLIWWCIERLRSGSWSAAARRSALLTCALLAGALSSALRPESWSMVAQAASLLLLLTGLGLLARPQPSSNSK